MRLSAEQLGEFKASGYLVLDAAGAIGEAQLAAWRGQLWRSFGVEETDPGSWAERRPLEGATVSPRLHELPRCWQIRAQVSAHRSSVYCSLRPQTPSACSSIRYSAEQRKPSASASASRKISHT